MSTEHKVEITDGAQTRLVGEWLGMVEVVEHLKKQEHGKLPGFALALALVESMEANQRSQMTAHNLRLAAKAGFDVGKIKQVTIGFNKGKPHLLVVEYDLADMADEA